MAVAHFLREIGDLGSGGAGVAQVAHPPPLPPPDIFLERLSLLRFSEGCLPDEPLSLILAALKAFLQEIGKHFQNVLAHGTEKLQNRKCYVWPEFASEQRTITVMRLTHHIL